MNAKRLTFTALILVALGGFLPGCRKPPEQSELPLVCSIPWQDDAFSAKVGMTDSLIYIVKLFKSEDEEYRIQLQRIPLSDPSHTDSSSAPSDGVDSLSSGPFLEGMRLPKASWIISPLPIGDTSRMLHFGHSEAVLSAKLHSKKLERKLREIGDFFYVVDVGAPGPRTLVAFEGYVFDALGSYFIMHTGISFTNDSAGYSFFSGRYNTDCADFTKSECLAVDLSNMKIAARIETPLADTETFTDWPKHHMMLDIEGKLLVVKDDPMRRKWDVPKVYLIEKNVIMRDPDYYTMLNVVFEKEKALLSWLHSIGLVRDFSWFTDLLFRRWVPFRAYGIGLYLQDVEAMDLPSGAVTTEDIILPGASTAKTVEGFRTPDGKVRYLLTPGISSSYYYPMGNLPGGYNHVPALSDLKTLPYEIESFQRFKLHAPLWELSPERRWLILYHESRDGRSRDASLVPIEALWDSTVLNDYKNFIRIPDVYWESRLEFVPGERWVYEREKWEPESQTLYDCEAGHPPVGILSPGESGIRNVFFSPDGRYVGYVTKVEGKEGFRLQVRELPER